MAEHQGQAKLRGTSTAPLEAKGSSNVDGVTRSATSENGANYNVACGATLRLAENP